MSTEHNAELALQHEVTKWISCYAKECRNLIKLSQQLLKCQTLQSKGEKVGTEYQKGCSLFTFITYFRMLRLSDLAWLILKLELMISDSN